MKTPQLLDRVFAGSWKFRKTRQGKRPAGGRRRMLTLDALERRDLLSASVVVGPQPLPPVLPSDGPALVAAATPVANAGSAVRASAVVAGPTAPATTWVGNFGRVSLFWQKQNNAVRYNVYVDLGGGRLYQIGTVSGDTCETQPPDYLICTIAHLNPQVRAKIAVEKRPTLGKRESLWIEFFNAESNDSPWPDSDVPKFDFCIPKESGTHKTEIVPTRDEQDRWRCELGSIEDLYGKVGDRTGAPYLELDGRQYSFEVSPGVP